MASVTPARNIKCKACEACRKRKTKCDRQPQCRHCRLAGRECVYPDDGRSHKTSPAEVRRLRSDLDNLRNKLAQSPSAVLPDSPGRQNAGRGPSSLEMHLASAVSQNGVQVHGASSMLHNHSAPRPLFSTETHRDEHNKASQARLVANASLQAQREALLDVKTAVIDFDGVEPSLAMHLIDTHFNRQHYTFMITYRPAIMDSLLRGGPYCNKVLLNAIYLSSSVYSGRPELRPDPDDNRNRFVRRLRELFGEHVDRPSLPTAAGLLLSGAILVSMGQMSAGWMHSGIAYRMTMDLGCHLAAEAPGDSLAADIDLEVRKRLYWGAFLTDATQSLYFGRPPTLHPAQARVSPDLLDTYEELEPWIPYRDPLRAEVGDFTPRPTYAISTFTAKVGLFTISSGFVDPFYGIQSLTLSSTQIRDLKASTESDLETWYTNLPDHLKLDLDGNEILPPHQITLLQVCPSWGHALTDRTTYHTFQILLRRPVTGHLSTHFTPADQTAAEEVSVTAALAIHKLVAKYASAYSLSRAPYLVSYSVYCAIVAILNQKTLPQTQFTETVDFFWTALGDLRRGSNFGLQKPMEILKELISQFRDAVPALAEWEYTPTEGFTWDSADDVLYGLFSDGLFC